jgi:hypothetical protein
MLFEHRPQIDPIMNKLIWILPILLVPASGVLLLIEKNTPAALGTLGLALVLTFGLQLLIESANKFIKNKGKIEVSDGGTLTIEQKGFNEHVELKGIKSFSLAQGPGMMTIKIVKQNDEKIQTAFPGNMRMEKQKAFISALSKFNVEVH